MADPNEQVPTHDLSHEPERSTFNAEGWTDVVDGQGTGAARLVEAKDSTSARVRALMETKGLSEQEASEQAINELDQTIEGKTADVATYIKHFAKVALTAEKVKEMNLDDPRQTGYASRLPFTARAILYPDKVGHGEFLLRYGAGDGSIKEVRIQYSNIANVRQSIGDRKPGVGYESYARDAYRYIKGELQRLKFHFEQPGAGMEDRSTPYDQKVSDNINQKKQAERSKAVEAERASFDF